MTKVYEIYTVSVKFSERLSATKSQSHKGANAYRGVGINQLMNTIFVRPGARILNVDVGM